MHVITYDLHLVQGKH